MPPTPHIRPNGLLSPSKLAHINNQVRLAWNLAGLASQVKDVWEHRPAWGVPPRDGDAQGAVAKEDSRGHGLAVAERSHGDNRTEPDVVREKLWETAPVQQPSEGVYDNISSNKDRSEASVLLDTAQPPPVTDRSGREGELQRHIKKEVVRRRHNESAASVERHHEEPISTTLSTSTARSTVNELSEVAEAVQDSQNVIRKYKYGTSKARARAVYLANGSGKLSDAQQSPVERQSEESPDPRSPVSVRSTALDKTSNIVEGGESTGKLRIRKRKNRVFRAEVALTHRMSAGLSNAQQAAAQASKSSVDSKGGSTGSKWGQFERAKEPKTAPPVASQGKNALDDMQKKKIDAGAAATRTVKGPAEWYADSPMEAIHSSAQEAIRPAARSLNQGGVENTSLPDDWKDSETAHMPVEARAAKRAIPLDGETRAFCDQNDICYKCRRKGHMAFDCPSLTPEERRRYFDKRLKRDGTTGALSPVAEPKWRLGSVSESGTSFIRLDHPTFASEKSTNSMAEDVITALEGSARNPNSKIKEPAMKEPQTTQGQAKEISATEPLPVPKVLDGPSPGAMGKSRGTDGLALDEASDKHMNPLAVLESSKDAEVLRNKQALSDITAELGQLRAQVGQITTLMQNLLNMERSHLTNKLEPKLAKDEDIIADRRSHTNETNVLSASETSKNQIEARHARIQSTVEEIRTAIENSQASADSLDKSGRSDRSLAIEELRTTIQDTTSARDSILEELFGEENGGEINALPELERSPPPRLNLSSSEALQAPQSPPRKLHPRKERMNQVSDAFNRLGRQPAALHLTHASENLSTADFMRLVPTGKHIAEWTKTSIFRVIAGRDLYLRPKGQYYLIFPSPAEARAYQMNVARIHRLAKLYTQTSLSSPIAPPPGYIIDGEDVHATMQSYALIPPSQPLHLNLVGPPWSSNFKEMVRLGGYKQLLPDPSQKIMLWVDGENQPSGAGLRNFITQDGLNRGLSWGVEKQSITALQTDDVVEIDLGLGQNKEVKKKGVQRWVIRFEDRKMALRFWRRWHRRVYPTEKGREEGEESVINVELIER